MMVTLSSDSCFCFPYVAAKDMVTLRSAFGFTYATEVDSHYDRTHHSTSPQEGPQATLRQPPPSRQRIVGYVRVSSEEQAREGMSLAMQRERLEAYVKANGWELVGVESDRGVSGFRKPFKRPAMARALRMVTTGKADGIAAVALDRLSRNAIETMLLIELSQQNGWRLIALDLALDTGTATGKLVAQVLAAVAEMYRNQISERTGQALAKLAREGRRNSGEAPYGFRHSDDGRVVQEPREYRALQQMRTLREEGEGPTSIARALNAADSPRRNGKPWARQHVWRVLDNFDARQETIGTSIA
jgi:site-specific DNA recombinase